MGYSGRYHAASLAAVFVALAIGILIGIGLADDVVSTASQEVEQSLRGDLDDAESRVDELEAEIDQRTRFDEQAGPALVANRLERDRVALIALGDFPDEETATDAQDAVEAAGGELAAVAIVDLPPDLAALRQAAGISEGNPPISPDQLGAAIGRQIPGGGPLVERVREQLFKRFNGSLDGVTHVVFVSRPPEELQADLDGDGRAFEASLIRSIDDRALGTVGVERASADPTTLPVFSSAGISTVDNIDQIPGQVSLVLALLGADGDFGVKEAATSLVPDLLPDPVEP